MRWKSGGTGEDGGILERREEVQKKVGKVVVLQPSVVRSPATAAAEEGEVCPHVSSGRTSQGCRWPDVGPAVCVSVCECVFVCKQVSVQRGQRRPETRAALADLMRWAGLP